SRSPTRRPRPPPTWPWRRRRPPSPRSASPFTCAAMSRSSAPADGLPAGAQAAARPAGSGRCRWGVIGAGRIARQFAAALASSRTGTLVAVASSAPARARALAAAAEAAGLAGRVAVHGGYAALLADPDVDAVYIAARHPEHAALITASAAVG